MCSSMRSTPPPWVSQQRILAVQLTILITSGLFKEIVCDRYMLGEPLPVNVKIIAACNPYRLKKEDAEGPVGLVFQYQQGENPIPDPLEKLVYRVLPLPETMMEYVFDYGALPANTEKVLLILISLVHMPIHGCRTQLYCESILNRELEWTVRHFFKHDFIAAFTDCLCTSQAFMRAHFEGP